MNSYTLTSDSRRWWWPSAAAGAAALAAVTAVVAVPATGSAIPVDDTSAVVPIVSPDAFGDGRTRPCFMTRARWSIALDGFQPQCPVDDEPALVWTYVMRAGLDAGV